MIHMHIVTTLFLFNLKYVFHIKTIRMKHHEINK